MQHRIIYWRMAKREAVVDDVELAALRGSESRGEAYIEFLDGQPLEHTWDDRSHQWRAEGHGQGTAA